jgi:hypothetical protein
MRFLFFVLLSAMKTASAPSPPPRYLARPPATSAEPPPYPSWTPELMRAWTAYTVAQNARSSSSLGASLADQPTVLRLFGESSCAASAAGAGASGASSSSSSAAPPPYPPPHVAAAAAAALAAPITENYRVSPYRGVLTFASEAELARRVRLWSYLGVDLPSATPRQLRDYKAPRQFDKTN